eukprot:3618657-Prymnesium_polylepis.2
MNLAIKAAPPPKGRPAAAGRLGLSNAIKVRRRRLAAPRPARPPAPRRISARRASRTQPHACAFAAPFPAMHRAAHSALPLAVRHCPSPCGVTPRRAAPRHAIDAGGRAAEWRR